MASIKILQSISLIVFSSFTFAGCTHLLSANKYEHNINVIKNTNENIKYYSAKTNQTYEIFLDSNPSTGYSWKIVQKPTENAVVALSPNVYYLEIDKNILGQNGTQKIEVTLNKVGVYEIIVEYSRPWKSDDKLKVIKKIIFEATK